MSLPLVQRRDERYMHMACRLARKAAGRTSPNPMVGAVLIRGEEVVGTGFHKFAGGDHAEIEALKRAGPRARGATLYINLEPCSHQGRTPPCAPALIAAGIKQVVVGMKDPNPRVSGRGLRQLRRAGIRVRSGILEAECQELNEAFSKFIVRNVPFVLLKLAVSLDGKIATKAGDARWISNADSRRMVHDLRNRVDAVLAGAGTVLIDDPQLTCRIPHGRNPWRVVLDARLRVPLSAQLFRQRDPEKNIIVTTDQSPEKKIRLLQATGAEVWKFAPRNGTIPWLPLLRKLAARGIVSIMIEGGAITAASALREKVVDKVLLFYAPKFIGADGRAMIEGLGIRQVRYSIPVRNINVARSGGDDIVVSGYLTESDR